VRKALQGSVYRFAGADALAHILEASRRGTENYPASDFSPSGPEELSPLSGAAFEAQNPRMYNRWGAPTPRDPFALARLNNLDNLAVPPPMFNDMRYQD
jgi:hypothetical protein